MHFDDRLATVLRPRAGGAAMARIQYRQLLDLLGTLPVEAEGVQFEAACDRLGKLAGKIPPATRAAMLREPGLRLRNPRLVALLTGGESVVAEAAIDAAQLREEEWLDLAPALPQAARRLVGRRRDLGPRATALFDRLGIVPPGLPPAEPSEVTAARSAEAAGTGDIGAIVQRIEDFRKAREPGEADSATTGASPEPNPARSPSRLKAFDFATDAEGCVVWSDPGMAPMTIGLRLASRDILGPASACAVLALALRRQQPVRSLAVEIAGGPAIGGAWQIDAAPSFDPQTGAYRGHSGRMRRPIDRAMLRPPVERESEADRMRQLLHELRTPVNAVQGFAEVIQQQLFGPAPHEYRALAAAIAGDAAHVLAGLDELERLARLESGRMELEAGGCDLMAVIAATVAQLRPFSEPRGSGFTLSRSGQGPLPIKLGEDETERLIWRLLASLAGSAAPGEVLKMRGWRRGDTVWLSVLLPNALAARDDDQLLDALAAPASKAVSAGVFGTGFSLRLATAEAAAAGGALTRKDKRLRLSLPGLTASEPGHSHGKGDRAQI